MDNAAALFYDDPREYRYTTLGDMPKPIQAMQYIYAAPAALDFLPITQIEKKSAAVPSGGTEVFVPSSDRIARLNSPGNPLYRRFLPQGCIVGPRCREESGLHWMSHKARDGKGKRQEDWNSQSSTVRKETHHEDPGCYACCKKVAKRREDPTGCYRSQNGKGQLNPKGGQ